MNVTGLRCVERQLKYCSPTSYPIMSSSIMMCSSCGGMSYPMMSSCLQTPKLLSRNSCPQTPKLPNSCPQTPVPKLLSPMRSLTGTAVRSRPQTPVPKILSPTAPTYRYEMAERVVVPDDFRVSCIRPSKGHQASPGAPGQQATTFSNGRIGEQLRYERQGHQASPGAQGQHAATFSDGRMGEQLRSGRQGHQASPGA